jgi:hypothetical protein
MDRDSIMCWNMAKYAGKAEAALIMLRIHIDCSSGIEDRVKKELLDMIAADIERLNHIWENRSIEPIV